MSKPNLIIDVLPSLNGKAYYLPLGPKSSNDIERLKIALRLKITNDDPDHDPITIVGITFSFPGTDLGIRTMFKEQKYIDPEGGELALGETATWSNGSVCLVDTTNGCPGEEKRFNQVYLDTPAPEEIKINVHCEEFTEPASKTVDLIPWEDPTGDGPLILPFAANNLDDDEYIVTSARHWYNGGSNGTQIFAHDMSIQAQVDNEWTSVRAGSDPDNLANEDIRVFGRPIRAMADGEVFKVEDIFADNPYGTELTDSTYGTNCVWVRYGDLEVKYSHLRSGSIKFSPADLPQEVVAGQKLAEGGNSGNTSGSPHLHMECRVSSTHSNVDLRKTLCGFVFKRTWMVERSQIPTTGGNGPRVSLKAQGICQETAALRPFKPGLGPFGPVGLSDIELETLVAEVFGGVSKGGDGFAIVGGKIVKVPPRGIKFKLLQSVLDLDAIDQIGKGMSSQLTDKIENVIKEIRKELGKHGG